MWSFLILTMRIESHYQQQASDTEEAGYSNQRRWFFHPILLDGWWATSLVGFRCCGQWEKQHGFICFTQGAVNTAT
jgi:hypothetical protein